MANAGVAERGGARGARILRAGPGQWLGGAARSDAGRARQVATVHRPIRTLLHLKWVLAKSCLSPLTNTALHSLSPPLPSRSDALRPRKAC